MKTIFRFMQFVVLFSLISITLAACGGGGGSDGIPLASNSGQPTVQLSGTIGPAGGAIEVTDSHSDMFRAKIVIPPGALDSDTAISLTKVETALSMPLNIREGGVAIDFSPDGTVFNSNVTITIPYDDVDNDGYVDHTSILESELKVIYWDSSTKQWTNIDNIINRDTVNNTITFETNHFSKFTTQLHCPDDKHGPVFIYTLDGLEFKDLKNILNDDFSFRSTGYLYAGILEEGIVDKCDCYSGGGLTPEDSWHGDAKWTAKLIPGLIDDLKEAEAYAADNKQKFVVVAHSWGTQLGTIGLSKSGVKADLFITLSDPEGSIYVKKGENEGNYSNYWFQIYPLPTRVEDAVGIINGFVGTHGVGHYSPIEMNVTKWTNYWDVGDIISGPLPYVDNNNNNKVDNQPLYSYHNVRDINSTSMVHAITSICCEGNKYWTGGDSNWKKYEVVSLGKTFRKKVAQNIKAILPVSSPYTSSTTGAVKGKLHIGSAAGPVLPGATVTCGGQSSMTSDYGTFILDHIPAGTHTITFSKTGYETYERLVIVHEKLDTDIYDRWLVASYVQPVPKIGEIDLSIHELDLSGNGEEHKRGLHLAPGEDFYINVKIKNHGTVTAKKDDYRICYLLSYDDRIGPGDENYSDENGEENIKAGDTEGSGRHVKAPKRPGVYYIGARVYSKQDKNEQNDFSRGYDERAKITVERPTHTISGSVLYNGAGLAGVNVYLSGTGSVVTDANGVYRLTNIPDAVYRLTVSKAGYTFSPSTKVITVNGANVAIADNIIATVAAPTAGAQWAKTVTAGNDVSLFRGVSLVSDGSIYVAGNIMGTGTFDFGNSVTATGKYNGGQLAYSSNIVLLKYNSSGVAQWAKTVTAGDSASHFSAVSAASDGSVYAAGAISGTGTCDFGNSITAIGKYSGDQLALLSGNILLVKYNGSGVAQWAKTVTAGNNASASAFSAVSIASDGSVYAAGAISGNDTYDFGNSVTVTGTQATINIFLVKYNSSGVAQWAKTVTAGESISLFNAVSVASDGSVYAAGAISGGTYDFGNSVTATVPYGSIILVKYNSSGVAQWAKTVTAGANSSWCSSVSVASDGSVYVAGNIVGTGTFDFGNSVTATGTYSGPSFGNIILVKYNSSGVAQWAKTVTAGDSASTFNAVSAATDGSVYAAGYIAGTGIYDFGNSVTATGTYGGDPFGNIILVKYNSSGVAQWAKTVTAGDSASLFSAVSAGSDGSVYAAGYIFRTGTFDFGNSVTATGTFNNGTNIMSNNVLLVKYF